uniref:BSD domain-containing protein n=1 Tax=Strigamia maritima TaxID=126957 RepID=T1JJR8_STRMM
MDMFNSVSSSVTTWWGTKGMKKPNDGEKIEDSKTEPLLPPPETTSTDPVTLPSNDEPSKGNKSPAGSDKSSATSEADSASIVSQPEDIPEDVKEKQGFGGIAGDIEEVSNKALQSAKNLGSFLFSGVKKAGKTVTDTAKHFKHTVEENSILGDFNKEQEAFLQDKNQQRTEAAVPPWVGYSEEEDMRQQILGLSMDRRNFLRSPPTGVSFQFNYDTMHPIAQATLAEDENLQKMRFELVPKCINEENFWKNYFYRVSLIKQSAQLSSLAQETGSTGGDSSGKSSRKSSVGDSKELLKKESETSITEELSTNQKSSDKIQAETNGDDAKARRIHNENEEEWEKELQQELQEYEVVTEGEQPHMDDAEWEKEIQKMLAAEDSHNKNTG